MLRDLFPVAVGYPPVSGTNQMHHVGCGSWSPVDCFGKAFQCVTVDNKDIVDPAVGDFCAHLRPECCTFIGSYPQAQDVLDAFHVHTDSHVDRLVDDAFVVTDFYT